MRYSNVLRIRSFRDLWLGQAISMLGDALYFVTFAFMVKQITHSSAMVGYVTAVEMLPFLLVSPYAGVLADRLDRKMIMLVSDLACATILLLFAGLIVATKGHPPTWTLFIVVFSTSTVRAFFMPAKNAAIPNLVNSTYLNQANALNGLTQSVMPMISLSISASVISAIFAWSPSTFFATSILLNALSFLGSAIFIVRLPEIRPDRKAHEEMPHVWGDLKAGIRYVRSRRVLWVMLLLQSVLTISISPFFVVYVAVNEAWFGGRPASLSWFECAFCAGMVLSNTWVANLNLKRPGQGYIWALGTVGLCVVAMAFSTSFWLFLFWQAVCGLAIPFVDIPMMTWRQTAIPDEFRGRFNSLMSMVQNGIAPIGLSLGGVMIDKCGIVGSFMIMGFGMFAASMSGLLDREFRSLRIGEEDLIGPTPEPTIA